MAKLTPLTDPANFDFDFDDVTAAVAFRFDKNQPRDNDGKWTDGFPGVNPPDLASKPSGTKTGGSTKKVTPAVIYKKHDDGAVVGHSASGQRMRWDAGRKKFVVEKQKNDSWVEESAHTKTSAYNEMKNPDKWFEPAETGTENEPSSPSLTPEPAPVDTDTTAETTPSALSGDDAYASVPLGDANFNDDERDAVDSYVISTGYEDINTALREADGDTSAIAATMDDGTPVSDRVTQLDDTLKKSELKESVQLNRFVNLDSIFGDDAENDLTGKSFTDHAFISTTTLTPDEFSEAHDYEDELDGMPMLNITAEPGVHGIAIGDVQGDNEVLLERGLTFEITDDREIDGRRVLDVTVKPRSSETLPPALPTVPAAPKADVTHTAAPATSMPALTPDNIDAIWDHVQTLNVGDVVAVGKKGTFRLVVTGGPTTKQLTMEFLDDDGTWEYHASVGASKQKLESHLKDEQQYPSTAVGWKLAPGEVPDVAPEIPKQADAPEIESITPEYTGPTATGYEGTPKVTADALRDAYIAEIRHERRVKARGEELRTADPEKYKGWAAFDQSENDARAELASDAPPEHVLADALKMLDDAQSEYGTYDKVRRRLNYEASLEVSFEQFSEKHGLGKLTPAVKADLAKQTKDAFAGKKVAVRVSAKTVEHILNDGRFKSQFESGKSKGKKDTDMRSSVEKTLFGIDDKPWQNAEKRPIYGYVAVDGIRPAGIGSNQLGDPSTDQLTQYGNVQVVLKDSVRSRTTAMFGDSLNEMTQGTPSPIDDPDWKSYTAGLGIISSQGLDGLDRSGESAQFRSNSYAEAQIHNGVSVDDIEEIVFAAAPTAALKKQLDDAGIPYRVLTFKTAADGSDEERAAALRIARQDKDLIESEIKKIDGKIADSKVKGYDASDWVKDRAKYEKQLKTINDALPLLEGTKTSPAKKVAAAKAKVANAKFTPDERKAIKTWQGADHTKIQKALRAGDTTPDVALLDSAIEKSAPLPKSTLYRGLTPDFMPEDLKTPGQVFTDLGFLATSKSQPNDTMFENYHHVIISTPDGAKGLDIGSGPYDEVLLPRGSRLRIDRVEQNRTMEGTTVTLYDVHATLLTDEESKASDTEVVLPEVPKQPEAPKIESTPAEGVKMFSIPPSVAKAMQDEYIDLIKQQDFFGNLPDDKKQQKDNLVKQITDMIDDKDEATRAIETLEQLGRVEQTYDEFRARHNITTPAKEHKAELAAKVKDAFADKDIAIRVTPESLSSILASGRFMSQFESGLATGVQDMGGKARHEASWFGTSPRAKDDKEKRAIYGYVAMNGIVPADSDGSAWKGGPDKLSMFGKVQVVLKKDVRSRTAAMYGDSAVNWSEGRLSPIDNPTWESFTGIGDPKNFSREKALRDLDRDPASFKFRSTAYAEAAITGGVTADDIAEVVFDKNPTPAIQEQLAEKGIPWRVLTIATAVKAAKPNEREPIRRMLVANVQHYEEAIKAAEAERDEYEAKGWTGSVKEQNTEIKKLNAQLTKAKNSLAKFVKVAA